MPVIHHAFGEASSNIALRDSVIPVKIVRLILSLPIIAMNDTTNLPPLPDRLSIDPRSPHHNAAIFERDVGIRLNDKERFDVDEYCVSEGWVKVPAGKTLDRKGNPLMIKIKGKVEPFYR